VPEPVSARSQGRSRRWWLAGSAAATALLATAAGCGSGGGETAGLGSGVSGSGTLVYALPGGVREVDPLLAGSRSELLVTRQVHEPLVDNLTAPFGDVRRARGLAIAWRSAAGGEIWSFRLREGIRFQDGTPLNASAVLANAERWRTLAPGRQLLPELVAADAPRPDLVRFILSAPAPDLPERLSSPRLGIVSPRALRPHSGFAAQLARTDRSGTGPFELRERSADGPIVLARNTGWWGTRLELGPALDELEFEVVPGRSERVATLIQAGAQVADSLQASDIPELRADPLLTYVRARDGTVLGLERSVRGIDSATAVDSLSGVWLTVVGSE
jgi:ABC-type transport system substrate-binding protein